MLLEAMACGASVAATATAAMEEYLQDGRSNLALPAGDPVGVAKVIERALGDEAQRRRIGRAARHRVLDSFTFQQLWAAVADILREAAVRPRF
ncbi:glycosyltransferase [Amycolatopsis sp. H6(2020)]|nr:glycosyltransferase [Amycolatopsis sp. H6(2020)]